MSAVKIIAVDPGGTTGLALAVFIDGVVTRFEATERAPMEAVQWVEWELNEKFSGDPNEATLVACENFIPRPGVRTWQPDALHIIGALRYMTWLRGEQVALQSPGDAKRFATNDKLEKIGWRSRTPGGHADDAVRHLMIAAVRADVLDTTELL